jgi:hypothetical protein
MTIKELKKRIESMPDEVVVVIDASDHSYRRTYVAEKVEAVITKHKEYSEYFGTEYLNRGDKVVEVFRIN